MRLANRRLTEVSVVTKVKREWLPRQKSIRDHTRPRNQPNIDEHCHSSTTRRFSQTLRVQSTSLLPLIRHDLQDIEFTIDAGSGIERLFIKQILKIKGLL